MGLPRRHPRRARGGGVRRLGGARLGHRAARPSGATARTARAWCSSGRSPTRSRRPSRWSATPRCPRASSTSSTGSTTATRSSRWCTRTPPELRRMAVFDAVVNNADRKGGHVLAMTDGHRYGVDHGLTFHVEHKLRTVLWGWAGELARPTRTAPASSSSSDRLDGRPGRAPARRCSRRTRSRRPGAGSSGCCGSAPCRSPARAGAPSRGRRSDTRTTSRRRLP